MSGLPVSEGATGIAGTGLAGAAGEAGIEYGFFVATGVGDVATGLLSSPASGGSDKGGACAYAGTHKPPRKNVTNLRVFVCISTTCFGLLIARMNIGIEANHARTLCTNMLNRLSINCGCVI
jgi:hypothetical protein